MKVIGVHEGRRLNLPQFTTTDGSKFNNLDDANKHQIWLNKLPTSLLKHDPERMVPLDLKD